MITEGFFILKQQRKKKSCVKVVPLTNPHLDCYLIITKSPHIYHCLLSFLPKPLCPMLPSKSPSLCSSFTFMYIFCFSFLDSSLPCICPNQFNSFFYNLYDQLYLANFTSYLFISQPLAVCFTCNFSQVPAFCLIGRPEVEGSHFRTLYVVCDVCYRDIHTQFINYKYYDC